MIKKLQKEFITISIIAVVSVMVLLCVIVNVANFVSVNSRLNNTIEMISSNRGMMPDFNRPDKPQDGGQKPDFRRFDSQFNEETPFSTRFFVLYYNEDGTLIRSDLEKIAAVTEAETQTYLDIALKNGEGNGFTDGYKYRL